MRRRLKAERGVRKACEKWLKEELRGRVRGGPWEGMGNSTCWRVLHQYANEVAW
jgi:hypothetical protein